VRVSDRERQLRLLHVSDIHCGYPFVARQVEAAERLALSQPIDAIIVSGDLSQRARAHELREARGILDRFAAIAPTIVVPGNHDTQWWYAPFGIGRRARLHERWRAIVQPETEPTLRLPGVNLVGLNSSAGMLPQALTWYARDWRVKGGLTPAQLRDAVTRLNTSPAGDLRVLVLHHNVVRGRLSNRWGLTQPERMLDAIAATGADVVCAGHDHEERVELVERATGRFVSSTANTLSRRVRGHRASAVTMIEADAREIAVTIWPFDAMRGAFVAGQRKLFPRPVRHL
jgi:3',5'-cyclic AMP phosphodiesterase CpdA